MENHPGYLHGLYPCPVLSSSSSMEGGRGVGGRSIEACYTSRVPRAISNFSATNHRMVERDWKKEKRVSITLVLS